MDHAQPRPEPPPDPLLPPGRSPRGMVLGATALLSGFVLFSVPTLWTEYQALRADWEQIRQGTPLGFIDISPNPTYAELPRDWQHAENGSLYLWSNWDGTEHRWFRMKEGDIDTSLLQRPIGRDTVRAITEPIVEIGQGFHWDRLLAETPMVSLTLDGAENGYPLLLLQKVEVVNDTIGKTPITVVCTPFVPTESSVHVYDPVVSGQRLTFGLSGHFYGRARSPLLYDHQTQSLWIASDSGLTCLAGTHRDARLRLIEKPVPTNWEDWRDEHPGGRLIVGAERGHNRPKLPPAL